MMKKKSKWKQYMPFYLLILPGFIYLFCNNYLPMVGLYLAFTKVNLFKGIFGGEWIGLTNFSYLVKSPNFLFMVRNTVGYNILFLVFAPILGIMLAFFLNELSGKYMQKIHQTIILLPALISVQIITYMVYAFLSVDTGMLNNTILPLFGMGRVQWYAAKEYWPYILTFVHFWMTIGFSCVIYFSSMLSISPEYYEAAELDGARKWKQFICITLPMLKPTIITLTIIGLGSIFKSDFGLFYQVPMNNGALYDVTQTIDTYVFRGLVGTGNLGFSAAAGFLQSVIGLITVLFANFVIRKVSPDDAMF